MYCYIYSDDDNVFTSATYLKANAKRFSRYRIREFTKVAGTAIENHLIIIQAKLYPSFLTIYFTIRPEKNR